MEKYNLFKDGDRGINYDFHIVWDRYGSFGLKWVCVAGDSGAEEWAELADDLSAGDNDMIAAVSKLTKLIAEGRCFVGVGDTPAETVKDAENKISSRFSRV